MGTLGSIVLIVNAVLRVFTSTAVSDKSALLSNE